MSDAIEPDVEVEVDEFLVEADSQFSQDVILDGAVATDDARCYMSRDSAGQLNPWIRCGPAVVASGDAPWFTYPTELVRADSFDANSPLSPSLAGGYTGNTDVDGLELLFRPDGKTPDSTEVLMPGPEPLTESGADMSRVVFADTCVDRGVPCETSVDLVLTDGVCVQHVGQRAWDTWFDSSLDREATMFDIDAAFSAAGFILERERVASAITFGRHLRQGVQLEVEVKDIEVLREAISETVTPAAFVALTRNRTLVIEAETENDARTALAAYAASAGTPEIVNDYVSVGAANLVNCPNP